MQKELAQLNKLIERKKEYLQGCENPRAANAIKSEINTIQNFICAAEIKNLNDDIVLTLGETLKQVEKLKDSILRLECICLMHGITDYPALINKDCIILQNEVLEMYEENQIRIPEKLKNLFNLK